MSSYLSRLPDATVDRASGRALTFEGAAAADRELVRRLAWALFRQFEDEVIRVPLFWGMTWKVRLGDLRPFWERIFGPELGPELPELEIPPSAA